MRNWLAGNEDDCWQKAISIEDQRQKIFKKSKKWPFTEAESDERHSCEGKSYQRRPETLSAEQKKKFKRVKNLINVGEVSKAMSALLSNGVAKVDKEVLNQLKNKTSFPSYSSKTSFSGTNHGRKR